MRQYLEPPFAGSATAHTPVGNDDHVRLNFGMEAETLPAESAESYKQNHITSMHVQHDVYNRAVIL